LPFLGQIHGFEQPTVAKNG